jgi:hypothetical protein
MTVDSYHLRLLLVIWLILDSSFYILRPSGSTSEVKLRRARSLLKRLMPECVL